MDENDEVVRDVSKALEYIRNHQEINNVLLTGGDPLIMSTAKLENVIKPLREMDHIKIIRIGTKIPIFNPYRILSDPSLLDLFRTYSTATRKIYIMAHFNHPRELTVESIKAMNLLRQAGVKL